MAMDVLVDFGNAWIKWYVPKTGERGRVRHAIAELDPGAWQQVADGNKPLHEGYIYTLGRGYAVGDRARRHTLKDRPKGASRYRVDYYGVGLSYVLAQVVPKGHTKIVLKASYAPGDYMHAGSLVKAAKREWKIWHSGSEKQITCKVVDVQTFDEPFGGWANLVFTKDGYPKQQANDLLQLTTYVLDIGGHTVDGVAIDSNGQIDFTSAVSTRTGVLHIMERFERELRTRYPDKFRDVHDIDQARLERALDEGVFRFGRVELDARSNATQLKTALVNEINDMFISQAGGLANYDVIVLTGGGAALLFDMLSHAMPDAYFLLASGVDDIQYANVLGGHKLFEMIKRVNNE